MSSGVEKVINLSEFKKKNGYKFFYIISREREGVSGETGESIEDAKYTEYLQFEGEFNELKYDWTDDISKAAKFKAAELAKTMYEYYVDDINIIDDGGKGTMSICNCYMYTEYDTDLDIKFCIYQLGNVETYFENV